MSLCTLAAAGARPTPRRPSPPVAPVAASAAPVLSRHLRLLGTVSISSSADEPTEGYFSQPRYRGRCEPGLLTGRTYGNKVNAHDDHWKIVLYHASCSLEIELEGDIRFTADDRGIEQMGRGAELTIEEDSRPRASWWSTAGPGGEPRYRFTVDGDDRPFDAAARRWLAEVLPEIFRATGLRAPERVDAVAWRREACPRSLAEIRLMSSDHVQGLYFGETLRQHS